MKKYVFLYDYDSRTIGFYNDLLPGGKKNKKISNIVSNIIYFIIIVIFGYIGFFYGKKVYDKVRKKKIYEIDDEYEYKREEKIYPHLEMTTNFK